MSIESQLKAQLAENRDIVQALLDDGSEPDAEYTIEHHFSSSNFDRLEKAAVDAFKLSSLICLQNQSTNIGQNS